MVWEGGWATGVCPNNANIRKKNFPGNDFIVRLEHGKYNY